jgi:hemoglobin
MIRRGMVWVLVVAGLGGAAAGQTPADVAALDKLVYDGLKEMHNRAADLYNAGDANGCYRTFQGGLFMARPLLAHRPDVQLVLDQGVQEAERQPAIWQRAQRLHKTIEAMREKLKPAAAVRPPDRPVPGTAPGGSPMPASPGSNPPPTSNPPAPGTNPGGPPTPPANPPPGAPGGGPDLAPPAAAGRSLWLRLGGEAKLEKVIDEFYTLAANDPKVNFTRNGKYTIDEKDFKYKLLCYVSTLTGGTLVYKGKSMAEAHKGMAITAAEFDALAGWLKSALETNNVPAAEVDELMQKLRESRNDIVAPIAGDK